MKQQPFLFLKPSPPSCEPGVRTVRRKSRPHNRVRALRPVLQVLVRDHVAQCPQLIATGRNELSAHAAFLDPVTFHNTLDRSPIVPRGQSGHNVLLHRPLQFSVLPATDVDKTLGCSGRGDEGLEALHEFSLALLELKGLERLVGVGRGWGVGHRVVRACPMGVESFPFSMAKR